MLRVSVIHRAWQSVSRKRQVETRATILGHMQRGGSPTCKDRVYATTMGAMAVDLLCEGKSNRVIGHKGGKFVDFDIDEALAMKKDVDEYMKSQRHWYSYSFYWRT